MNLQEVKEEVAAYRRKIKKARKYSFSLIIACNLQPLATRTFLIPSLFPEDWENIQAEFSKQGCVVSGGFVDVGSHLDYFETFLDLVLIYAEESE